MENKNFAVIYNPLVEHSVMLRDKLAAILKTQNITCSTADINNLSSGYDYVFVLGGDGTILKTCRFYAKFNTPVFGINLGRLGFLSQTSADDIAEAIKKIINKKFKIEDRIMLKCNSSTALNDFVIKSSRYGRTSKFTLKINGNPVCDYLADGIIVSTPTGSTAYGLSAGGPVISPELGVMLIVPICPHTLTARPLVIPDTETITISGDKTNKEFLIYADGQECLEMDVEINIKKSEHSAKLIMLDDVDFYSVLRNKLFWGVSPANI